MRVSVTRVSVTRVRVMRWRVMQGLTTSGGGPRLAAILLVVGVLAACDDAGERAPAGATTTPAGATVSAPVSEPGSARPRSSAPRATTDPTDLVESVRWVRRGGRPSLEVVPSARQREHRDEATIAAAWGSIVRRHPDVDRPGMRDQYACHVAFAPTKDAFYLEPWRPAVGYVRTVAEACNPGERKDLG